MATRGDHSDFSVQTVNECKINTARYSYIIKIFKNLPYSFRNKWYTLEHIHGFIMDGIARTISLYELRKILQYKHKLIPHLHVEKYNNIRYYQFGMNSQIILQRPCSDDLLTLPPVFRLDNTITNDNVPEQKTCDPIACTVNTQNSIGASTASSSSVLCSVLPTSVRNSTNIQYIWVTRSQVLTWIVNFLIE